MSIDRAIFGLFPFLLAAPLAPLGAQVEGLPVVEGWSRCPQVVAATDDDACADWRWIGVKDGRHLNEACPLVFGFDGRHLFETDFCRQIRAELGGEPFDCPPEDIPQGLRPFCVYERSGLGLFSSQEPDPTLIPGLQEIERDCAAVVPLGSTLEDALRPALAAHFLDEAGKIALPPPPGGTPRVRLAVVDTAPTNGQSPENDPYNSPHGYTLVNMARALLCEGGACAADVTSRLALAYLSFNPLWGGASVRDEVRGGFVGMIGELAEAVRLEVEAWQGSGQDLVLNLSVGWDPRFGGLEPTPAAMPPGVRAVYRALEDALCRGALAVVAAGNRGWGPRLENSLGPMLPAAWETRRSPTNAACAAALFFDGPPALSDASDSAYRPLLYAAGGLRRDGRALPNARFEGEPRLAAFADHATVEPSIGAPPTTVLTGSSVAALVTSASAAAAWHFLPDDDPFETMERTYGAGAGLGRQAHFRLEDKSGDEVRWARVCEAAKGACQACQGAECLPCPPAPCPTSGLPPAIGPALVTLGEPPDAGADKGHPVFRGRGYPGLCPPSPIHRLVGGFERYAGPSARPALFPCPHWQLPDTALQAWTGPQPGTNPCPACTLDPGKGNGVLHVAIDESFAGELREPSIKVGQDLYATGVGPLRAGDRFVVPLPPELGPVDLDTDVLFVGVVDGPESAVSPVLVVP